MKEEKKKSILEVKFSQDKELNFQRLLEGLLKDGYDFFIQEGQTEIWVYFKETSFNLIISRNGNWRIE